MRIIGGCLKGRQLFSVKGMQTRPTADRLRETIFNILSFRVQDTIVLDLFAGTGALGIEALSRGAREAVFIDYDRKVIDVIRRNIELLKLTSETKIIKWNILRNLNCIRNRRPAFNLVFMDPPYTKNLVNPTLFNLHGGNCLKEGALIVIEHTPAEKIVQPLDAYTIVDHRLYGKSLVSILGYMV